MQNGTLKELPANFLKQLPNLEAIACIDCGLEKLSPTVFGGEEASPKSPKITSLKINYGKLDSLASFQFTRLSNLTELRLGFNQIATIKPDAFVGLQALTTLDLKYNRLTQLPEGTFLHLPVLEDLFLSRNELRKFDFDLLVKNPHMDYVDLEANRVQRIKCKSKKLSVKNVVLKNNQLRGLLSALHRMKHLEGLWLTDNSYVELDGGSFAGLEKLKYLFLEGTNLQKLRNFTVFSGLSSLQVLDIRRNHLQALPLAKFPVLPQVTSLILDDNSVKSFDVDQLTEKLPKLKTLSISNNNWDCGFLEDLLKKLAAMQVVSSTYNVESEYRDKYIGGVGCNDAAVDF
jgi:insulin-like growth factor-binding protein complex acid labile subunit